MATLTDAIKTDLYRFFAVAFHAAPGTVYMGQLVDAVEAGDMSVEQIVEVFTGKTQFTDTYPKYMSNADFAAKLVGNVVGSAASDAAKAQAAKDIVDAMALGFSRGKVIYTIFGNLAKLSGDATWGDTAKQLSNQVEYAKHYTEMLGGGSTDLGALRAVISGVSAASPVSAAAMNAALSAVSTATTLKVGLDNIVGTAGNDTFDAYVVNNANTLESGDRINGGGGVDSLNAVLASSSDFAITPRTSGVEAVFIRAQSTDTNGSSGENNVNSQTRQKVTVDAQDMVGVTQWHNVDSRADLKIEDVRILEGQITKDIVIRLADTDPGSMGGLAGAGGGNGVMTSDRTDYELYFSPESLRAAGPTQANSTVTFRFSDNRGTASKPAASLNVDINFTYNGKAYTIKGVNSGSTDTTDAGGFYAPGTYAQFVTNLNAKLKAVPELAGLVAVDAGAVAALDVTNADGNSVQQLTPFGRAITITDPAGKLFASPSFNAGTSGATFSIDGNSVLGSPSTTNFLITSTIILDNVGRESEAGALVIGSMSTRTGVERFEITVDNNDNTSGTRTTSGSWLGSISSTNNRLQEVVAVNAPVGASGPDYLYIGTGASAGNNLTAPRAAAGLLGTGGLTDVRLFDASAMSGVVRVGASITADSIAKYQNTTDSATNDAADNVAFVYSTGSGNDSINLSIDGTTASSQTVSGRHDFTFAINGNAGNDRINVAIVNTAATDGGNSGTPNWYSNQAVNNNVTIDGGAGNDTITKPGAGNVNILAGAGDDTVYTENTGTGAVFVFNNAVGSLETTDLRGDVAGSVSAVNAQLRVNYGGLLSGLISIGGSVGSATNVAISDLTVNQAIKDAINNDAVLSKLLLATDGPGRTLIVTALTDGADTAAGLTVEFSTAAATAAQAAATQFSAAAGVADLRSRYATEVATTNGVAQTGSNGVDTTDNTITGGTGNDVIVLSTNATVDAFTSSNEVIVFGAGFGNDTIVNFNVAGSGIDYLDFSGLGGTTATQTLTTDKSISFFAETTANDTVAEIAALYNANNAAAQTHVYVAVNTTANADGTTSNSMKVYSVADAAGATNAVATLEGTITFDNGVNVLTTAPSFATAVPAAFARTIAAADAGNANIGGTSGGDTVVMRGGYAAGVYSGVDAAGRDLTGAQNGGALRAYTGTINLGAGADTLITYGALDLTGATLTSVETITANSGLVMNASQLLGRVLTFVGNVTHRLVINNDLGAGQTLDLSKIVLSQGALLVNVPAGTSYTGVITDNSSTGGAWQANITANDVLVTPTNATVVGSNTAPPADAAPIPTGTGTGSTGGGI